ncbi:5-formyltetrahydrofolate cyclo-ligase [Marinobacter sediminicola]|uniref:5-formyltetrahydrofolate cyclo-ligase n=1 Tax=Marinobacter sediminicola TaxID=3072994 RepID=UPI003F49A9A1
MLSQTTDSHPSEFDLPPSSRNALRKHLRQLRCALSARDQEQASASLALNLLKNPDLYRAKHIAIYLPNDGEIDPHPYMAMARARSKEVHFYLPVLHPIHPGRLVFSPYYDGIELTANRFGIPEPAFSKGLRRPAWALDAVMFPLVGFDANGGRLGMGGGFYDRTFAFTRLRPRLAPKLIGLAHNFQKVDKLPIEPWDVPLHSVVTDSQVYRVK